MLNKFFFLRCILILTFVSGKYTYLIPNNTEQIYELKNRFEIIDLRSIPYIAGYEISTKVKVISVWANEESQFLHFILDPVTQISTKFTKNKNDIPRYKPEASEELKKLNYLEFYVHLHNGLIKNFWSHKNDKDAFSLNFKRGVASLFQFTTGSDGAVIKETDSLGECDVIYVHKTSSRTLKTKSNCRDWDLKVGQRRLNALGIKRQSNQDFDYKLSQDGSLLHELNAVETHFVILPVKNHIGVQIESHLNLKHVLSTEATEQKISAKNIDEIIKDITDFQIFNIESNIDGRVSQLNVNLKSLVKLYRNELNNLKIGKLSTAYIFTQLLETARITKTEEFIQILKSPANAENLYQLVDIMGATQTIHSHNAFMTVFNLENEDDFDIVERYLQSLAVGSRPSKEIFLNLYEILISKNFIHDNLKLYDTLLQTLASIANKYSSISPYLFEDSICLKIRDYILSKLNHCKNSNCKTMYIRALQNLRDPTTLSTLSVFALEEDKIASVQAMKALKSFDVNLFTKNYHKIFENIFYQISKKFDSSARILALDILLSMKPSKNVLINLIDFLNSGDKAFEIKRYLIEKLRSMSSKCLNFKNLLNNVLNLKPNVNNYHILGQKGLSSVLERSLSSTPALNESLLSTQEILNGVLKQGYVDYILTVRGDEISTFKLGLYTSGLSSFMSNENSDELNEETSDEMEAGMEIAVNNVSFRPLVFFNGQTELMGHIWSGTASEPTTAYKATSQQQDHEEFILLQNGGTVFINIIGAKSIDLNGKIDFSLWNRNAQSEIKKNSGEVIYGAVSYETSFIKLKNEFTIESSPEISVNAFVDFYSDIKLCIQLEKPKSIFRHRIENTLQLKGANKTKRNSVRVNYKIPGRTLVLNQKNNEMCNTIAY